MNAQAKIYLAVAAGSALGTLARVGIADMWPVGVDAFPWPTLVANASGSFLIGVYGRLPVTRRFMMDGFCGGFTTFSIFSLEAFRLADQGLPGQAGVYVAASVVAWLACVWAGYAFAHKLCPGDVRRPGRG